VEVYSLSSLRKKKKKKKKKTSFLLMNFLWCVLIKWDITSYINLSNNTLVEYEMY